MLSLLNQLNPSPREVCRNLQNTLYDLDSECDPEETKMKILKYLKQIKKMLLGTVNEERSTKEEIEQIAYELCHNKSFILLLQNTYTLDFETKATVEYIFCEVIKYDHPNGDSTHEYIRRNPDIMYILLNCCEMQGLAAHCGEMLRDCIFFEGLAKLLLNSDTMSAIYLLIQNQSFEIATISFMLFHQLLTGHKQIVAIFLENNYDNFFKRFNQMVHSQNIIIRSESLRLLNQLLAEPYNVDVKTTYLSKFENLHTIATIFRHNNKTVQHEALQVLNKFILNDQKTLQMYSGILRIKKELLVFVKSFQHETESNINLNDDLKKAIDEIESMIRDDDKTIPFDQDREDTTQQNFTECLENLIAGIAELIPRENEDD